MIEQGLHLRWWGICYFLHHFKSFPPKLCGEFFYMYREKRKI